MKKILSLIVCAALALTVLSAALAENARTASSRTGNITARASKAAAAQPIAAAIRALTRLYDKGGVREAEREVARLAGFGTDRMPEPLKEFVEIARAMIRDPKENRVDFGTMSSLIIAAAEDVFDSKTLSVLDVFLQKLSDRAAI